MKPIFNPLIITLFALLLSSSLHAAEVNNNPKDFALQLLGSGGPVSDDMRASSGEVIWWKGKSAILIDAGGGVFLRFGQAGARVEDLKLIAITHFHTDHTSDLPALLKGAYFFNHKDTVTLSGPAAGGVFPSASEFFSRLFDSKQGAFSYLSGLYNATDGLKLAVKVEDIDYRTAIPVPIFSGDGLNVTALGIPHGNVPCLAYRIDTSKGSIMISADQSGTENNGKRQAFIQFAKGADILVMPLAITENADANSQFMHAAPDVVGIIAHDIHPRILVLNHFMGKALRQKAENIRIVKKYYHGDVYAGRDLSFFPMSLVKTTPPTESSK